MKYVEQNKLREYIEKAKKHEGFLIYYGHKLIDYCKYFEFYPFDMKQSVLTSDIRRFN